MKHKIFFAVVLALLIAQQAKSKTNNLMSSDSVVYVSSTGANYSFDSEAPSESNQQGKPEVFDVSRQLIVFEKFLVADYENTQRNLSLSNVEFRMAIIHRNGAADLSKYLRMY